MRWDKAKERAFLGLGENEAEHEWRGPFRFVVMADTQLGMIERNMHWEQEVANIRTAVVRLNQLLPKFAIVCGDLVHAHLQMHKIDPRVVESQVAAFKESFQELDSRIQLVCVCGNHDVGNSPTQKTIDEYRQRFGDDYFAFWAGGVRCVVVNSMLYSDPSQAEDLAEKQHCWLQQELEASQSRAKHILVFGHIPWFLYSEDEPDDVGTFSTYRGEKIANGYFHIPMAQRMRVLELLHRYGVRAAFSGHWHQNGGATSRQGLEMIITSALSAQLGSDQPGFRVVQVTEDSIEHHYQSL